MKYKPGLIFLHILFTLLFSFSCTHNSKETTQLLNQVEHIIIQQPDSAYHLLKTILNPEKLNIAQYNKYYLLLIQAKDKRYEDITSDTLIYNVRDYYVDKEDYSNAALAQYYCGRVLHEQQKIEEATTAYLQAEQYAEHTDNDNLKGLIQYSLGALLYEQSSKEDALNRYKQSLVYFQKAGNYRNEIMLYSLIGDCYLLKREYDIALQNYEKGLNLAETISDTLQWASLKHCIGLVYKEKMKFREAESCFRESLLFTPPEELARTYMVMAKLFHKEKQLDSANYYTQKAKEHSLEIKDAFFLAGMNDIQMQTKENQGDYQEALGYAKEYIDIILDLYEDHRDQSVLDIQKKYDSEMTENENKRLQIEQQKAGLFLLLLVIIILILLFYLYYKRIKNKQKELNTQQKLRQFMEMAEGYDKKEQSLRTLLLEHFEVLKKAALLDTYIYKEETKQEQRLIKKFNEVVYDADTFNWDKLYQTMNELHNGLFNKLRHQYPQWDETEFRVCCLTYVKFSIAEIAIILNMSDNTIQMKRASIRKKLGVEAGGNIVNFIDENVLSDK